MENGFRTKLSSLAANRSMISALMSLAVRVEFGKQAFLYAP